MRNPMVHNLSCQGAEGGFGAVLGRLVPRKRFMVHKVFLGRCCTKVVQGCTCQGGPRGCKRFMVHKDCPGQWCTSSWCGVGKVGARLGRCTGTLRCTFLMGRSLHQIGGCTGQPVHKDPLRGALGAVHKGSWCTRLHARHARGRCVHKVAKEVVPLHQGGGVHRILCCKALPRC